MWRLPAFIELSEEAKPSECTMWRAAAFISQTALEYDVETDWFYRAK